MLLGVLFDIDALDGGLYGYKGYKVLFAAVHLRDLAGCALSDGDTRATLSGQKREYCIAIESSSASQLARVREALLRSTAPGLLPPADRFITDAAVAREPLVLAAQITPGGELVQYTGWVRQAWEKCSEERRAPVAGASPSSFPATPIVAAPAPVAGVMPAATPAPFAALTPSVPAAARRPGCVTAYALLLFLGAGILMLGGIALAGSGAIGGLQLFLFLALGGVELAIAIGLWRMRNWARVLLLVVQGLGIAVSTFSLLGGSGTSGVLVGVAVAAFIISWFARNGRLFR